MEKYSTTIQRIAAAWVDGLVLMPLAWFNFQAFESGDKDLIIIYMAIYVSVPVFYSILMHATWGWTLGKRALNLKVVQHKDEENKLQPFQALLRDIVPLLMLPFMVYFSTVYLINPNYEASETMQIFGKFIVSFYWIWYILEIVTMLFNKKRRALHDFLAGTVVIKTNLPRDKENIEFTPSMKPQMPEE